MKQKLEFIEKEREHIENKKMGDIIGKVKLIDCKILEELDENLDSIISNISSITNYGKERQILKFENIEGSYVPIIGQKKVLQDERRDIDLNFKININLNEIKTGGN